MSQIFVRVRSGARKRSKTKFWCPVPPRNSKGTQGGRGVRRSQPFYPMDLPPKFFETKDVLRESRRRCCFKAIHDARAVKAFQSVARRFLKPMIPGAPQGCRALAETRWLKRRRSIAWRRAERRQDSVAIEKKEAGQLDGVKERLSSSTPRGTCPDEVRSVAAIHLRPVWNRQKGTARKQSGAVVTNVTVVTTRERGF